MTFSFTETKEKGIFQICKHTRKEQSYYCKLRAHDSHVHALDMLDLILFQIYARTNLSNFQQSTNVQFPYSPLSFPYT